MAATIKYGDTKWAVKDGNTLGYNDENRFKPVPFDFTRNSIGTRVDRNGLIETIGNNIPRIDFTDNTDGHLLLEPQSTNLVTYSEDFSQSVWEYSGDLSLESGYTAPDGSNTAYKVTSTNSSLAANLSATNTQARSIWARTVSGTGTIQLLTHNSNTNNTFTITSQWQRFELNSTTSAIGVPFFYALDFRGAGTTLDEVIIWGAQLEALSYPTSYIPTNGSTVTRDAETCTNAGNSTLINSTEGVLYAEIAALADDGLNKRITISDGTLTNRITLTLGNNNISGFINANNVTQYTFFESITTTDFNKIAIKFKANDFAVWINGVEYDVDTSGSTFSANTLNVINFANATITDNDFYGKCKALTVYNTALTDAELIELTS